MSDASSQSPSGAEQILQDHARTLDEYLRDALPRESGTPSRLTEAIEYSLFAGGKRLRPALLIECFRACGATFSPDRSVLAAAGAIELIHTFSLVHDDLPAMDDDDLRRGRPTNHKIFGEAMAILAGDAMVALAFELLARDAAHALVGPLVRELAVATGMAGMIGGQVRDIQSENRALDLKELSSLHQMKTGALITAACRMGAICASANSDILDAATRLGTHLGLAFQIVDDLLDVTATPEQLGKKTGKDTHRGKNTFPALLGLDESRSAAQRELESAIAAAEVLVDPTSLIPLVRFVVDRRK